jgi:hypothetical protein
MGGADPIPVPPSGALAVSATFTTMSSMAMPLGVPS